MVFGCKENQTTTTTQGSSSPPAPGGGGAAGGPAIIIGEYGSLTGTQADFGVQTDQGIQLAASEINATGGIEREGKKMPVQIAVDDDKSLAQLAETSVKRLIDEKHVIAVLGEVASSASLAGGKVCQDKGIPMISPSSTNVDVTKGRDMVFRVCFLDSYQAAVVARFAIDGLKAKRVAVFTNKSQAYSTGFSSEFKKAFAKYGGQIVADQSYSQDDQDFRGALTAIKAANPDAILVPGYYNDAGSIVKQARDLGIKVPLLGGDGWSSSKLLTIAGPAANGCYFSDHMSIKDPKPLVQDFVANYKKKFNADPTSMSALGYDAARIMFDAIKRSKSLGGKDIRDAIAQTKDFSGVTGNITINANHDADKSAVIIAVKNGAFEYAATIPDPNKPMSAK
ncbi:MAG TPA: ABC transporter substrate-binding protein [Chthonomonadaceae bacterium]|nr:ABC transporter substrate-binding protein [Chthonomonadaceae bacterium]